MAQYIRIPAAEEQANLLIVKLLQRSMREPACRETEQFVADRTRCNQDAVAPVALGDLFDCVDQAAALLRIHHLIESVEQEEQRVLFKQNVEHLGSDMNIHAFQHDLGHVGEETAIGLLHTDLGEVVQLDAQWYRLAGQQREVAGRAMQEACRRVTPRQVARHRRFARSWSAEQDDVGRTLEQAGNGVIFLLPALRRVEQQNMLWYKDRLQFGVLVAQLLGNDAWQLQ